MAKNTKEDSSQGLKNVEETLTRTEHYLEENYKTLLIILGAAVLLVGLFYLGRIYLNKRNKEAQEQMFHAQKWLGMDSLKLALNGDGNYLGFLDIANNYKMTKAGNLAKYSAGMCYLHLGQFQEAIDFLSAYKHNDNVISSLAVGGIGDAYVELGNLDKGVEKYIEAANLGKNSFNTPIFLMKAGQIYELQQKYSDALKVYERIRDEYPESTEGTTIEKYISRVQLHTK